MITGFWNKTKVYCCQHEEQEMTLVLHTNIPYYECPICHRKITCFEFEKMINHFQKVIVDGVKNDEEINLAHSVWKNKVASYKVLEHSKDGMKVSVNVNES